MLKIEDVPAVERPGIIAVVRESIPVGRPDPDTGRQLHVPAGTLAVVNQEDGRAVLVIDSGRSRVTFEAGDPFPRLDVMERVLVAVARPVRVEDLPDTDAPGVVVRLTRGVPLARAEDCPEGVRPVEWAAGSLAIAHRFRGGVRVAIHDGPTVVFKAGCDLAALERLDFVP